MGEPLTDEECDQFFAALDQDGGDSEMVDLDGVSKKLLPKLELNLLAAGRADQSTDQVANDSKDF